MDIRNIFRIIKKFRAMDVLHPGTVLVYYLGFLCFTFIFNAPIYIITICFFAVLYALIYGKSSVKSIIGLLLFCLIFAFINPLFNHGGVTVLFYIFNIKITLEAFVYGFYGGLLIYALMVMFVSFNGIITSEKFLYLFEHLAPTFGFIMNMSLKFISTYEIKIAELVGVQKVRGISVAEGKLKKRIKNGGELLKIFLTLNLEEGMELSQTLKTKDYGKYKRSPYVKYNFSHQDVMCILFLFVLIVYLFVGSFTGAGHIDYYPAIRRNAVNNSLLHYLVFLIYLMFPIFVEAVPFAKRILTKSGEEYDAVKFRGL